MPIVTLVGVNPRSVVAVVLTALSGGVIPEVLEWTEQAPATRATMQTTVIRLVTLITALRPIGTGGRWRRRSGSPTRTDPCHRRTRQGRQSPARPGDAL